MQSVQDLKPLPLAWRGSAKAFAALGDEYRQRIVLMCRRRSEMRLQDLHASLPLSRTAIAHHVKVLRDAGLLTAQKRGGEICLRVNTEALRRLAKVARQP